MFTTQLTTNSPRFTTTLHHEIRKYPCKTALHHLKFNCTKTNKETQRPQKKSWTIRR
jgi:hypothetical protein